MVYKVMSGGQTGVDRAALDVALANDIACGGWCPKGRMAEDGPLDARYPLVETTAPSPTQRTEWNVRDADGTLIITWGPPTGGTFRTAAVAKRMKKAVLTIDMTQNPTVETVVEWIAKHNIHVLNIAGPRASEVQNAYEDSKAFLLKLLVEEEEA